MLIISTWRQNRYKFVFSIEKARATAAHMVFLFVNMICSPLTQGKDFAFLSNQFDCDFLHPLNMNSTILCRDMT